jgi:hypothetical protein
MNCEGKSQSEVISVVFHKFTSCIHKWSLLFLDDEQKKWMSSARDAAMW